jgi:hypothetical protein
VEQQVVTGLVENVVEALERKAEHLGEVVQFRRGARGVVGMMPLREDGKFERKAAGVRAEEKEAVVFRDEPRTVLAFRVQDVAEKAALLLLEMLPGADELALD